MVTAGKEFEYPAFCRLLWYVGILFGVSFVIASVYALLTRDFSFQSFLWIFGIFFGTGMAVGSMVELLNYQTISVSDSGISTLGPNRRVFIPWTDIGKVFYSRGEGAGAAQPFISFYISSKDHKIIKVSQYISNFHELGEIILERTPTGRAEYTSFSELAKLYYRLFFKKAGE